MKTIQLFDACLTITIPDSFVELEPEEMKRYFIGSAIPEYGCIDREEKSVISVIRTGKKLKSDALQQQISAYQQSYARMIPGFVMGQMASRIVNGNPVFAMSFQSNAPTENVLNVVALLSMNGEEVLLYSVTPLNGKTNKNFHLITNVIASVVIEEAVKHDV